jgi:hypothetical protein
MTKGELCREFCKPLPEHLVEIIFARIPFPSIFKVRCLSKSWLARFSSPALQEDESKTPDAISFQKLVSDNSRNWKTFAPVLVSTEGDLVAYNMDTREWWKLPPLPFCRYSLPTTSELFFEGALLYTFHNPLDGSVFVAHILTQVVQVLTPPRRKDIEFYRYCKLVMIDRSLQTYKLILLFQKRFTFDSFENFA